MKPFYRILTYLALVIQSLIILCLLAERKMATDTGAPTLCRQERSQPKTGRCRQWDTPLHAVAPECLVSGIGQIAR